MMIRASLITATLTAALSLAVTAQTRRPALQIWDDVALADWATPIAGLNVRLVEPADQRGQEGPAAAWPR